MIRFLVKLPIFKRLIPSIGIRVLRFFKKNRGYFKIGEINFYLDFLDPIDRQIILHKNYENDQVIFLEKEMEKNLFDYFLDVGANSGYYSFLFANKFENLKVKAFEPNLDAFNKFKKTLNKNSIQNIEVFNFGLSDQERKVKVKTLAVKWQLNSLFSIQYLQYSLQLFALQYIKYLVDSSTKSCVTGIYIFSFLTQQLAFAFASNHW